MGLKDHENQEDMKMSKKENYIACNIYHTLWKICKEGNMPYIQYMWDYMFVPNVYQQTQI